MTEQELRTAVVDRLRNSGLSRYLDDRRSQFLELEGRYFAEIVLSDGEGLAPVKSVMDQMKSEMTAKGLDLDVITRALWKVEGIGNASPAYSMDTGSPRAAVQYPVELRSGEAHHRIWVEVTYLASEIFTRHSLDENRVKNIVRELVEGQLRLGGTSYWDPLRSPHLEINGNTAEFLVMDVLKAR